MGDASVVGKIPAEARAWKVQKQTEKSGKTGWKSQFSPIEKGGAVVSTFPIERFSVDVIYATWGPGTYKVQFFADVDGTPKLVRTSAVFRLDGPSKKKKKPAAQVATTAGDATSSLSPDVRLFMMLQREARADARADADARIRSAEIAAQSNLQIITTLVTPLLAAKGGGGGDDRLARAIEKMTETLDALGERIEDIEDRLDDEDEEDDARGSEEVPLVGPDGLNVAAAGVKALQEIGEVVKPMVQAKIASMAAAGGGS